MTDPVHDSLPPCFLLTSHEPAIADVAPHFLEQTSSNSENGKPDNEQRFGGRELRCDRALNELYSWYAANNLEQEEDQRTKAKVAPTHTEPPMGENGEHKRIDDHKHNTDDHPSNPAWV